MDIEDSIRMVYECSICHEHHDTIEACRKCVESHKDELDCVRIHLYFSMPVRMIIKGYEFHVHETKCKKGMGPKTEAYCFGTWEEYQIFETECLHTPEEILKAKRRLLEAAIKWADRYVEKIKMMQVELERGGGEQ